MPDYRPKKLHLDRRAAAIAAHGPGEPDDLLTTQEVAEWFGVSRGWLEINRQRGDEFTPPFVRLGGRVRYRRADCLAWLEERTTRHSMKRQAPAPSEAAAPRPTAPRIQLLRQGAQVET